jgi:16S rRNA processing protein RimM
LSTSSTDPELLEVGRILRPHGLRGRVIVELWTNRAERVQAGSRLEGPAGALLVAAATRQPGAGGWERWLVSFEGVDDHEQAEALRGAVLRAEPIEDGDALWVHDLVGAEVVDPDGRHIGVVQAVEANPASDLLVLDGGALIPLRFVVDHGPGRVTADLPPGLLEL